MIRYENRFAMDTSVSSNAKLFFPNPHQSECDVSFQSCLGTVDSLRNWQVLEDRPSCSDVQPVESDGKRDEPPRALA